MPLARKLRAGHVIDAVRHLYRRNVRFPALLRREFDRRQHPFLINLEPSCLAGDYYTDNDAVYLVDREEVIDELNALQAEDITPALFSEWGRPIPDDPCVVVARKRG